MRRFNWLTQRLCALNILLLTVSMTPASAFTPVEMQGTHNWHDLGYAAKNFNSGCEVHGEITNDHAFVVIHYHNPNITFQGEPASGGSS